jgi:hypothetical protein
MVQPACVYCRPVVAICCVQACKVKGLMLSSPDLVPPAISRCVRCSGTFNLYCLAQLQNGFRSLLSGSQMQGCACRSLVWQKYLQSVEDLLQALGLIWMLCWTTAIPAKISQKGGSIGVTAVIASNFWMLSMQVALLHCWLCSNAVCVVVRKGPAEATARSRSQQWPL